MYFTGCKECKTGFQGGDCKNKNECSLSNGGCDSNSQCKDTVGSFNCQCKTGFTKDAKNPLKCIEINECDSNPCLNDAVCVDKLNGYECKCKAGFKGSTCGGGNLNFFPKIFLS